MNQPITREQFPYWHTIVVRWGDMDALGHVNNTVYFMYCESARIALLRELDNLNPRGRAEGSQCGPTLVATSCDFKREVRYPATLDVGVRVTQLTPRSFTMEYGMFFHGTEEVAALARSVNAWVDYAAKRAVVLPEALRAVLERYQISAATE